MPAVADRTPALDRAFDHLAQGPLHQVVQGLAALSYLRKTAVGDQKFLRLGEHAAKNDDHEVVPQ